MLYLIGSVLFIAINNVLWSHYAPLHSSLRLIAKRAFYTSCYLAVILAVLVVTEQITIQKNISKLVPPAIFGFIGLLSLVNGFKKGSITQFSVYSLMLVFFMGLSTSRELINPILHRPWPLIFVVLGYSYFIWKQFNLPKSNNVFLAHAYFALAHLCFGVMLYLQWKLLKGTSHVTLAFTQEFLILIAASVINSFNPTLQKRVKVIKEWEYALLALPISVAVILGLEGLKSTHPFHATLIGLLTPAVTLMLGVVIKKDVFNKNAIIGLVFMLAGLFWFYL